MEFLGGINLSKSIISSKKNFAFNDNYFQIISKSKPYIKNDLVIFQFNKITDFLSQNLDYSLLKGDQKKIIYDLFISKGEDFIKFLEGNFLIIIYNLKNKELYIYNNMYSNTQFYYLISNK